MSPTLEIKGSIPEIVRNDNGLYQGNLVVYFQALFNHGQNLTNPYHNFRHICHVLWLCYQACRFYAGRLSPRKMRNLLVAAIFHDFDHTGVAGPDHVNIERALEAFRCHVLEEDREYQDEIERLISLTEYPYTVSSEELDPWLDLPALILRDADLSQGFSVAWIQQVIFGLATEWGKTPLEVLESQRPFLSNLHYHSEWGQTMYPAQVVEQKIAEAEELIDLLLIFG